MDAKGGGARQRALLIGLIVVVIGGAIAWWRVSAPPMPVMAVMPAADKPATLPVDSVLRVKPSPASSAAVPAPVRARTPPISPLIAQYRTRRDFAALYAALLQSPPTPESLYVRAEIYRECARPAGQTKQGAELDRMAEREKFAAGLGQSVAAMQRLAAFDKLHADPCAGLEIGAFDPAEMARLVDAAADAGDPRAQAWQLAQRIERTRYEGRTTDSTGYAVNQADFDAMRRLMATADPEVIQDLQNVLSSSLQHGSLRLNSEPVDPASFHAALTLLACDQGANCGADSQTILANCAYRGRCAAASLYEYMYYYENSPADSQQIDHYRRAWRAMLNAGDLSALTLSPVDGMPGFTMTFGGRRSFRPRP